MEQQNHLTDLTIDSVGKQELLEVAKWGRFLSIIGFVFMALLVIIGFFAGSVISKLGAYGGDSGATAGVGGFVGVIYAVFALIYFFPVLFLFQSSTKMKSALHTNDQQLFNEALIKMKACFRYVGILTIIVLAFYALAIFFLVIASFMK